MDHTEAVLVEFDPNLVGYDDVVISWTKMHTPTDDKKCQYKSAIWFLNEDQREIAEEIIDSWKLFVKKPLYTSAEKATDFYRAEEYHQHYLQKRGGKWDIL